MPKPAVARRSASPLVGKLRDQLAAQKRRASLVRGELKKAYNPAVMAGFTVATSAGGAVAGGVRGYMGPGMVSDYGVPAAGVALVLLGAFGLKGATGGAVSLLGAGILAKCAGDAVEGMAAAMGGE